MLKNDKTPLCPSTTQNLYQADFNANVHAWLNIGHVEQNISVSIEEEIVNRAPKLIGNHIVRVEWSRDR